MTQQPHGTPDPIDETPVEPATPPSQEQRQWAMWCHLAGLAGYLPVIPGLGSLIGPLIVWLIKKDEMPFVDDQGKQVINFKISVLIVALVLGVLSVIPPVFCVTIPLLVALLIADIVFTVVAAIRANEGQRYRYPYAWKFLS